LNLSSQPKKLTLTTRIFHSQKNAINTITPTSKSTTITMVYRSLSEFASSVKAPENILARRKRSEENKQAKLAHEAAISKKARKNRQVILKRAEKYAKEYQVEANRLALVKRQAAEHGNIYVEPEAKLAFVVRVRGLKSVSPKAKKALQLLRLRQINNGVFVRLNKATINMLRLVEPYVAYGYVDQKTVSDLLYKRGYAKVNGQRIPITNNTIVEQALGQYDIICVEDLIHQIVTVGPHFKQATNFLWPFKLTHPTGGYESIKKHFVLGGSFGNREEYMNQLVQKML
jgi:large subunit ribosomal protein L7e